MKHRAFTVIEAIVIVLIMAVLAVILFPTFASHCGPPSRRVQCQVNLKQIGLGFLQYAYDYDEHFPAVAASGGWANAVQPYTKDWQIFHCPSVRPKSADQTTDYFFNARAADLKLEKFEDRSLSILAGDGVPAQTTQAILSELPAKWRKFSTSLSPSERHPEGANYLFADGHVKWLKPEKVTLGKPSKNNPTFLVK